MIVRRLRTSENLAELSHVWERLAQGVPFRGAGWLATWWRHYGGRQEAAQPKSELYTLAVYDDAELIALAPWYVESFPLHGRVVRFLGSGEVCTDYQTVLCKPGWEAKVAARLADWLCSRAGADDPDGWEQLELSGIDAADSMMRSLTSRLAERGALPHCRLGHPCWRVELPGNWDEFMSRLSKSHRKELRACRRQYFDNGRAVLHTASDERQVDRLMGQLIDLHQRRRRSLGEPGCFASPRFTAFHRDVARRLLGAGRLRLHVLELDEQPVAAEYHLHGDDGILYAYQSGIEIAALEHGPGRLATIAVLRSAIADGYRAFDLLRGDEPYKAHWRAQPRPMVDVCVLRGRSTDRFRYGMWVAGDLMRDWIKSRDKPSEVWLETEHDFPAVSPAAEPETSTANKD